MGSGSRSGFASRWKVASGYTNLSESATLFVKTDVLLLVHMCTIIRFTVYKRAILLQCTANSIVENGKLPSPGTNSRTGKKQH